MKYVLKHKDIDVAEIELDEDTSAICKISPPISACHVPVGIPVKSNQIDRAALNAWWQGRAIPASRDGIRRALEELRLSTTAKLLDKCLGLSLSDQYWICPVNAPVAWKQVNFFDNEFSEDVGNILFGHGSSGDKIDLMSPDNTSDGWLKKSWKIIDGRRCLLKGGSGATQQEPYNEVFASAVMERLGIPHVPYSLITQEDYPYSVCEDFVTLETELVSAWYIMQTQKKENDASVYQHYINCCDSLGIPGVRDALDKMITLDYLIANEDRHQNNFGVLRNADTLEWLGPAPIYDSGSSLWFDKPQSMIHGKSKITSKPFKANHEEQIKLVRDFSWLDLSALDGIYNVYLDCTEQSPFMEDRRVTAICNAFWERVEALERFIQQRESLENSQSYEEQFDVTEDIAYSGD